MTDKLLLIFVSQIIHRGENPVATVWGMVLTKIIQVVKRPLGQLHLGVKRPLAYRDELACTSWLQCKGLKGRVQPARVQT